MVARQRVLILAGLALALASMAPDAAWSATFGPDAADDEPLPVDQALRVGPATWENGHLTIAFEAAPGCYFYRDRVTVESVGAPGPALALDLAPAGEPYVDAEFGEVRIWRGRQNASFNLETPPRQVKVRYQGCAEGKVCYSPQTRLLDVLRFN